jgi:hypothetical protein
MSTNTLRMTYRIGTRDGMGKFKDKVAPELCSQTARVHVSPQKFYFEQTGEMM